MHILLLLLRNNAKRQHSKELHQEKRKGRKTLKRRNEEKVVGFSSASLFPTRKWEVGPTVEPTGDRTSDTEENPGRRYRQMLGEQARPRPHSRYIHVKQE